MRDTVLALGDTLAIGQSVMGVCPECGHRKLSVTRYADGLGYLCWRASCDVRGSVATGVAGRTIAAPGASPFVPRPFLDYLHFPAGYAAEIEERLGFSIPGLWTSSGDRAVFLLADFAGNDRGWQSRTRTKLIASGKVRPGPLYGYYGCTREEPPCLWVVEDPLSAVRLKAGRADSVALLGTRLDVAILDELWDVYPNSRRIYVALDPGAEEDARTIVRTCRDLRGLDAIQVPLPDDIHRLDAETLALLLETYA